MLTFFNNSKLNYITDIKHKIRIGRRIIMIKKSPFLIKNVLDETIYYRFKDGVKEIIWTKDNKPITLRSFIDRNIDDAEIFPQYAKIKKENKKMIDEILRLRELLEPFEKNKGVGRRKGSYKLSYE